MLGRHDKGFNIIIGVMNVVHQDTKWYVSVVITERRLAI